MKIIEIWQNEGQRLRTLADLCHILTLICLKSGMQCDNNFKKTNITGTDSQRVTYFNVSLSPHMEYFQFNVNNFHIKYI